MNETMYSIIKWHEETFPEATLEGQRVKALEEAGEYVEVKDVKDFSKGIDELADVFIVGCGVARFSTVEALSVFDLVLLACRGPSPKATREDYKERVIQLGEAVDKKMEINRQRKWNKRNGMYKHVEE